MTEDHYTVLGIHRNASQKDILKAYRKLARRCHPDLNPGDPQAAKRFVRVQAAFDVLSDPGKRAEYNLTSISFTTTRSMRGAGQASSVQFRAPPRAASPSTPAAARGQASSVQFRTSSPPRTWWRGTCEFLIRHPVIPPALALIVVLLGSLIFWSHAARRDEDAGKAKTELDSPTMAQEEIAPAAKGTIPALINLLGDTKADVAKAAAKALGEMGPAARGAIPALVELTGHEDWDVRAAAIAALGKIDPAAKDAIPALAKLRGDAEPNIREAAAKALRQMGAGPRGAIPEEVVVDLGGGVKVEMVLIPAGEFIMGDDKGHDNEEPVHKVRITKPFYLGKYEVTQEQWEAVMHNNPSRFKGPKNPVEMVSWDDCQKFLEKLNAKIGTQGGKFVLPSEAQWEYACRAGSTGKFCFGDDEKQLGEYAWYSANSAGKTHPVGEKKPNAWGLYDMHGNVSEWCADWYDDGYYGKSPADDPVGHGNASARVNRGGSLVSDAWSCRSACRHLDSPGARWGSVGFRVSRVPADK